MDTGKKRKKKGGEPGYPAYAVTAVFYGAVANQRHP